MKRKAIQTPRPIEPIVPIVLLSIILRVFSINQSLWLDEATTARVSGMNVQTILQNFSQGDFHPPGYYLFMHFWTQLLGHSEFVLRLPSLVVSVLAVVLTYFLGKRLFNKEVGIVAALFLATSPLSIYYAQEARMYSLAMFLVLGAVYLWLNAVSSKKNRWWIALSFALFVTVAVDYIAILIVIPIVLVTAIYYKKSLKKLLGSFVIFGILASTLAPLLSNQLAAGMSVKANANEWWNILGKTTLKSGLLVPVKFLIGRVSFSSKFIYGMYVAGIGVVSAYLGRRALAKKEGRVIFTYLFVPVLAVALIGFFVPVLSYFRLLFCLPFFYLLLAGGLQLVKESRFLLLCSIILVSNIICSAMYLTDHRFQREDWRGFSNYVSNQTYTVSGTVIFVADSQMEAYQYYNSSVPAVSGADFEGNTSVVWLMRYVQDVFDPQDSVRAKVEEMGYTKAKELDFNGVVVWEYHKSE